MYITINDHNPKRKRKEFNRYELYTACKDIQEEINGCVFNAHGNLVAYWCAWENKVKAGHGACDIERKEINEGFRIGKKLRCEK